MTDIVQLIKDGAYPQNAAGLWLVPTRGGETAEIFATDLFCDTAAFGRQPIVGRFNDSAETWSADGSYAGSTNPDTLEYDLTPPAPQADALPTWHHHATRKSLRRAAHALPEAFLWGLTPEGFEYWATVTERFEYWRTVTERLEAMLSEYDDARAAS